MDFNQPILAIVTIVLAAGVISWAVYWDYRKKQLEHEERRLMIERGLTPPPVFSTSGWPQVKQHQQQLKWEERRLRIEKGLEVPPEEKRPMTPEDFLRRGTICFFLGIGLGLAYVIFRLSGLRVYGDEQAWLAGLAVSSPIVGLFGLGQVVYYLITKNRKLQASGGRGQVASMQ